MIGQLPPSLRGLMVAAFAAAYMSTVATQLNWGASYLVNDFYKRFFKKDGSSGTNVRASQWARCSWPSRPRRCLSFRLHRRLLEAAHRDRRGHRAGAAVCAGNWWRINAWSEVSAMLSAFAVSIAMQTVGGFR